MSSKKKIINIKRDGKIRWKLGNCYFQIFYSGEIHKNKPHGYGVSEGYQFDDFPKEVLKDIMNAFDYKEFWKKYSKDFIYKIKSYYILSERYEGYWKEGKKDGKGTLTSFAEPDIMAGKGEMLIEDDGSPKILEKKIGTFINDKEEGIFEEFDGFNWNKYQYKKGLRGKKK